MTATASLLVVLTNYQRLGAADDPTADPTGYHLSETAHPWRMAIDAGLCVTLASPRGGPVQPDPSSADLDDPVNRAFLADPAVQATLAETPALDRLNVLAFDALYFPGGHGTMWDLPGSASVQQAVTTMLDAARPVAAVCHGPAALVNARRADGRWCVEGCTVAAFTDEEERATGKDSLMPFSLVGKLAARGARLQAAPPFEPCATVHGTLITGQNPASARPVTQALLEMLRK